MKPWLIFVLLLAVIMIAAATTFIVLSMQNNQDPNGGNEVIEGPIYQLGEFTVNVPYQRTTRFVLTAISLMINDRRVSRELDDRSDQIRDRVITILRQSGEEAIEDPQAHFLREEIRQGINEIIGSDVVLNVYFTKFVIQ